MDQVWKHYLEILSDPAHTLVETTFIFLEFIIFQVFLTQAKKACQKLIKREHKILDREHGHQHESTSEEILWDVLHPLKSHKRQIFYKGRHRY